MIFTAQEDERLRTWLVEIAETILDSVQWQQEGDERRAKGHGGLTINIAKRCWYIHSEGKGGLSVIPLIAQLKGCSASAALDWAKAWGQEHPGTGRYAGADEDDVEIPSAPIAQDIINQLLNPAGTVAETYLRSRGIAGTLPDFIRFLPHARTGESAIVGLLTSHGRVVGCQVGYLDPDGCKSTIVPYRRRHMLEKAPDAAFELPATVDGPETLADTFVTEGLEDPLSLAEMGRPVRIIGLPGIGTMKHLQVKKGVRVVVVRDGDEPGSPADKALIAGVDHLLLEGAAVRVTDTPRGQDANSILRAAGLDALIELVDTARDAELSRDGEITRLSRLDPLDFDQECKPAAKRMGVLVETLRKAVARARARARPEQPEGGDEGDSGRVGKQLEFLDIDPWPEPVSGIDLLQDITETIGGLVIMGHEQRCAIALWVLFTHVFGIADTAPKLLLKSAEPRSGKTRVLRALGYLTPRPLTTSHVTPSTVFRVIEQHRPTLLLDEIDTFIRENEELRGILNSGFDKDGAAVLRIVHTSDHDMEPWAFSTWCPQALAGIGKVPETIADRCFTIELERKRRDQKVGRLRKRDAGPLLILARKAARWAADNVVALENAEPELPENLNDRASEAWELCIAIADQVGGDWPNWARQAALVISGDGAVEDESIGVQLLSDIRDVFATRAATRISSVDLVAALNAMEDRPWPEFGGSGRPLTTPTLAKLLKPFRISPGSVRTGKVSTPQGYKIETLQRVFPLYLPPLTHDSASTPAQPAENKAFPADFEPAHRGACAGPENPENTSVSAGCAGVLAENPEIYGGSGDGETGLASNGGSAPNGGSPLNRKRLTQLQRDIIAYDKESPGKVIADIAKHFGQPRKIVDDLLGRRT